MLPLRRWIIVADGCFRGGDARRSLCCMALAGIAGFLFIGCERRTDDRDIQWVAVSEAQTLNEPKGFAIGRTKKMSYVDPRTEKDYAAGHIPGAILVPFGDLRQGAAAQLIDYEIVIVYDTDFDDVVARALSKRLIEDGRWDVYTLTGGLRAWEKAGNEVAYGMPTKTTNDEGVAAEAVSKPRFGQSKKN